MLNNFLTNIAEGLFYLLGGAPLSDSFLIMIWISFWGLVSIIPLMIFTSTHKFRYPIVFIAFFFFGFIMAIGPPITQIELLKECQNITVFVEGGSSEGKNIRLHECRYKTNYYEEFGDWRILE